MRTLSVAAMVLVAATACQGAASVGTTCSRGSECATGTCEFGRCRAGCREFRDCPSGASCLLDATGTGACSLEIDLGCESGVGRACPAGLVCVADRCEQSCGGASVCPVDAECRAASAGGAMFCFDTRTPSDAGLPPSDAGTPCAITSMCFERVGAACARDCMGRVRCWGQQHAGRLGNGVTDGPELTTPTLVIDEGGHPLVDADSLACGDGFACVHIGQGSSIHSGHVLCWGYEASGAFDTSIGRATDLVPAIVGSSVDLSAASRHACLSVHDTDEVLCFGANDALIDPLMPDDTLFPHPTPPAGGIHGAMLLEVGAYGACVVQNDGTVRCWGDNSLGQSGHTPIEAVAGAFDPNVGQTVVETSPGVALSDVEELAVGYAQRAVITRVGATGPRRLLTWGGNESAQLGESPSWVGDDCDDARRLSPVCRARAATPASSPELSSIATAGDTSTTCGVVAATHHVLCWGDNLHSHAGRPGGGRQWIALDAEVQIEGTGAILDGVRDGGIFVGAENACAIRNDGSLWCWGSNTEAQLARPGDSIDRLAVPIAFPGP